MESTNTATWAWPGCVQGLARGRLSRTAVLSLSLFLLLFGVACDDSTGKPVLTVLADSSLEDAFGALSESFERSNPDIDVRFRFEDSNRLVQWLRNGAVADLVVTASTSTMQELEAAGLVQRPSTLTSNVLLVATRDGLTGFNAFEDLANQGLRVAVAAPGTAAGAYADAGILSAAAGLGEGWKQSVLSNLLEREADTRAVLGKVRTSAADAGIVYRSDLTSLATDVAIGALPFPARLGLAVVYPAALTARPPEVVLAKALFDFMLSDNGQAILEGFGFGASQ